MALHLHSQGQSAEMLFYRPILWPAVHRILFSFFRFAHITLLLNCNESISALAIPGNLGVYGRAYPIDAHNYLHATRFFVMLTEPPVTQEIELDCEEL